jgi:large subunit ribosomal protein L36
MSPLRSALSTASRSLLSVRQFALTSFRQNKSIYNHASSPFLQLRKFSSLLTQGRWGGLLRSKIAVGNAKQLSSTYIFSQASGMKTRSSVKRLCDGCKVSSLGRAFIGVSVWVIGDSDCYGSLCDGRIESTLSGTFCLLLLMFLIVEEG